MKKLISFTLIFVFCGLSLGATNSSLEKSPKLAPSVTPLNSSQADVELSVMKTQIDTMKQYHSSLLDTVYWALGTVVTVAALLVGFGWYANFQFHESEKERLRDELERRLKDALSSFETHLSSNEVKVIRLVDSKLDGYSVKIARDLDISRAEFVRMHEDNTETIKSQVVEIKELKNAMADSQKADLGLEVTLRRVEEYIWEIKDIPVNVLITQLQGLLSALKAGRKDDITSALERMQRTIKKSLLPQKKSLPDSVRESVQFALTEAAKIEPITAAGVAELMAQLPQDPSNKSA
jgi:hypothetical protein